jgi:hypothetical protein
MDDYLTINEAVRLTGKSGTAIRRLVERLSKEGNSQVVQKEETPQGYKYRISRAYLQQHYHLTSEPDTPLGEPEDIPPDTPSDSRIQLYEGTISLLKDQLQEKDRQIGQLLERHREMNILMNNYQQRLLGVKTEEVPPDSPQSNHVMWAWILMGLLLILVVVASYVQLRGG